MSNAPASYATRRWNPTTGCSPVAAGCANCWAARFAVRHAGRFGYPSAAPFTPTCHPDRLDEPLRWRKPQVVAVSFMGDLAHDGIDTEFIVNALGVMAGCRKHTFLVLTKRPQRLHTLLARMACATVRGSSEHPWPLPNVWLGISCEDQRSADERIPILLDTPAAHRWVSIEPQIGPVDLSRWLQPVAGYMLQRGSDCAHSAFATRLGWVVQGAESGLHRRPFDIAWARSVRDQCAAARVPYYLKQVQAPRLCDAGECSHEAGGCHDYDRCAGAVIKHALLDGVRHESTPFEVTP
jgi:protein gp37